MGKPRFSMFVGAPSEDAAIRESLCQVSSVVKWQVCVPWQPQVNSLAIDKLQFQQPYHARVQQYSRGHVCVTKEGAGD